MRYEVTGFAFDLADSWACAKEANRLVCHGPNREELIATAARVQGDPPGRDLPRLLDGLWSNALKAATDATSHPDLVVTSPLVQDENRAFPLAMVQAQTRDRAILFCVIAARAERSVLFVTFEATNDSASIRAFDALLESLHRT